MTRDVDLVKRLSVRVPVELFRLIVAAQAALARRFPLAVDDLEVALLACNAPTDDFLVAEPDRTDQDVAGRSLVAPGAPRDWGELPPVPRFLEVTQKAGPPVDLEVTVDDNLRVAARAA
jgi:hypothetical protein